MMICRLWFSKRWTRLCSLTWVLLLSAWLPAEVQAVTLSGTTRTEHFLIRHDPGLRPNAEIIGQACEDWLAKISLDLGLRRLPDSRIPVFLYRDQAEFRRATGRDRPGEVLGRASSRGYVELDASGIFAPPGQIAGHEIAHIVVFQILGGRIDALPLWVNDGIAKYMSGDTDALDRTILADAAAHGELLPLSALADTFPEKQESVAYAQSASAVTFFVRTYGKPALAALLHGTARTGSFEAAMQEATRDSAAAFEEKWRISVEGPFGARRLIRIIGAFGILVLPILAAAAFVAMRRRRRRAIERYELEEEAWGVTRDS